jgi:zinc transport system substrate-binding protein
MVSFGGPAAHAVVAVAIVWVVVVAGFVVYVTKRPPSDGRPLVVASFYPYAFAAEFVSGGRMRVVTLTPPGVEPHEWEPSPRDVQSIFEASVFIYNGYVESFLPRVLADLPADHPIAVNASVGMSMRTENGRVDPHVWLDPSLMRMIAGKVASAFIRADPAGASSYQANAESLNGSLASLDAVFAERLSGCRHRTIITAHEAFGYLAARYGLTVYSIQGLSPDAEPTPQKVREILDLVNATHVQYIFYETLVSPDVAQALANEAGIQTLVLDPLEGISAEGAVQGASYLTIMQQTNLPNLRTALECP